LSMLELSAVAARYGQFEALHSISLSVGEGETVALLGPNAAGKSTTLRCISRTLNHSRGDLLLFGENIATWGPKRMVEHGVIQVPEGRQVFPFLTVRENLEVGSYPKTARKHRKESMETVFEWLPALKGRQSQLAGTLSGGEQQMLAIGRAMMARPKLLMLDEPSLGLAPVVVMRVFDLISRFKSAGMTILLVEQNAHRALSICDRAYVLESGTVSLSGEPKDILAESRLRDAYLGTGKGPFG
jgi:branched-chain amino acid transport system ATP-binding protein